MSTRLLLSITALSLILTACGGAKTLGSLGERPDVDGPPPASDIPENIADIPDAVPRVEPLSRYGNPDAYEVLGKRYVVLESSVGYRERGDASWYGQKSQGRPTSSGERYDMFRMTAAHKTLPLPSYVRVTNLANGREVVLRVNDRGPFHSERIIDLSYAAAVRLDIIGNGTAPVEVVALQAGAQPGNAAADPALYLQAGAFSKAANARQLALRLESLGLSQVFVSPTLGDEPLYRVRLGPYADRAKMDAARATLNRQGINVGALRD